MTATWKVSGFALALVTGYLVRRFIERFQEAGRERAVLALGGLRRKRRSRKLIEEKRATWMLGVIAGWAMAAFLRTHEWEAGAWVLLGLYGLLDVRALNAQLTRRRRH